MAVLFSAQLCRGKLLKVFSETEKEPRKPRERTVYFIWEQERTVVSILSPFFKPTKSSIGLILGFFAHHDKNYPLFVRRVFAHSYNFDAHATYNTIQKVVLTARTALRTIHSCIYVFLFCNFDETRADCINCISN